MDRNIYTCIPIFLLLLWAASHLFFLSADAPEGLSGSRGPWSDEGLYSVQLRNFLAEGDFRMRGNDAFIKSPGYSLWLAAPLALSGGSREVARGWMLLTLTGLLLWIAGLNRARPWLPAMLLAFVLLRFPLYHFSHLALAEMNAAALIALSISLAARAPAARRPPLYWLGAQPALFAAFLLKLQFAYALPLTLLTALLFSFFPQGNRKGLRPALLTLLALCVAFYLLYYLPLREDFHFLMRVQSGAFVLDEHFGELIRYNWRLYFIAPDHLPYTLAFGLALGGGVFLYLRKKDPVFLLLFLGSLLWVGLEAHKMPMRYLPTRYLLSLYFAMGWTAAVVSGEALRQMGPRGRPLAAAAALLLFLAWPWEAHYRAWQDRSYGTRDLNHYLAHTYRGRGPLLGVWAASANWQCRGRALPVWHDFLHHERPLATYRPEAVIVEPEEEGCNQAFRRDGIDLAARSDSSRSFQIGPWPVVVYWIKE